MPDDNTSRIGLRSKTRTYRTTLVMFPHPAGILDQHEQAERLARRSDEAESLMALLSSSLLNNPILPLPYSLRGTMPARRALIAAMNFVRISSKSA
jgi:hypothetical protein